MTTQDSEHIKLRKNGTASFEGGEFRKPESNIEGRWQEFVDFTMFKPKGMQWLPNELYPTDIIPCKMKHYANGVRVIIPDGDEVAQVSKPSPSKGQHLYQKKQLAGGGIMRKARVSGDIKLELPLLKDGKLADLGDLVQDLMTAYYNIEWELEAKTLFSDNAA